MLSPATAAQLGKLAAQATATRYPDMAVANLPFSPRAGAVLHNGHTVQLGGVLLLVALRKDNSTVVRLSHGEGLVGVLMSWPSARGGAARISATEGPGATRLAVAEPEEAVRKPGAPRQDIVKPYLGLHMQLGQVGWEQNLSWFV